MSSDTPEGNQCTADEYPYRDEAVLKSLYLDEELSTYEVADRLDCSATTVRKWLDKHGIDRRGQGAISSGDRPWDDEETLRELYHGEGLSTYEISEKFACGEETIRKRMVKYDIPRRGSPSTSQPNAPWKDKETLQNLYLEENLSSREIGKRLGCCGGTIRTWLDKYNIQKRDPSQPTDYPWDDEETLRELYHERGLSIYEMAELWGCGTTVIRYRMEKYGISRRTSAEPKDYPWDNEETLRELYHGDKLTTREMADELDCAESTIRDRMDKHGISRRKAQNHFPTAPWKDNTHLRKLYHEQELSMVEIAERMECNSDTVWRWMKQHEIERRTPSEAQEIWMPDFDWPTGEDHPSYKHGNSHSRYYGPTWESSRQSALERDGYECRACGMTREEHIAEYGRDLHVHHIVPFESFDDSAVANQLDNLVTACATHHGKYEGLPVFPG